MRILFLVVNLVLLAACGGRKHAALEDLTGHEDLSFFKPGSVQGTRDGDRLDTQALFTDSSSMLTVQMRFEIGAPTRLVSGLWRWTRNNGATSGTVAERSVDFLGGQSGPPSFGGTFDLLFDGTPRYRIRIPLTELTNRLNRPPDWLRSLPSTRP